MRRHIWIVAATAAACTTNAQVEDRGEKNRVAEFHGYVDAAHGTMRIDLVGANASGLQLLNYQNDGTAGSGAANSVELVTTGAGTGWCGANSFGGDVTLNSFYAGAVSNLVVQIRTLSPATGHLPTNAGSHAPLDNGLGLWNYASSGASQTWCFEDFGTGDFEFTGVVWGDVAVGGGTFLATFGGTNWYTVPVTGFMTDNNILAACQGAGLLVPCQTNSSCQYNDGICSPVTGETSCGNPMLGLAQSICGGQPPSNCPALFNVFTYMGNNWLGGCGANSGSWCVIGNNAQNGLALCTDG